MSTPSRVIADAWNRFWFTVEPAYALGLVRIGYGALAVIWTLALRPELLLVFGADGAAPDYELRDFEWSVFTIWSGDTALQIGWVVLLVAAIALTVGWHSRLAAAVVFVLMYSFLRRAFYIVNAGDTIVVLVALVLAVSCCGSALSLDQRRRTGKFWSAEPLAQWPVRLLQVELVLIYVVAVQAKLMDRSWVDGSAVFYAWRTDGRWALLEAPDWLANNAILVNALSWGTLLVELSIAVLVWNRRCRPWVLGAGVLMHLMMMLTLNVAFFSLAMFVLYLAFVPSETLRDLPQRIAARRKRAPAELPG